MLKMKNWLMPIFPFRFYIYYGETLEGILRKAKFDVPNDVDQYLALCIEHKNNIHLFFQEKETNSQNIAHECSHAVDIIYNFICDNSNNNQELRAYLHGYIHQKVYNTLEKMRKS